MNQSVHLVTVRSNVSLLTEQLWGHRMLKLLLIIEWFSLLLFFNCYRRVLHFRAPSSYEGALTQKRWSSITEICPPFGSDFVCNSWKLKRKQRFKIQCQFQHSMALLKWHDARINWSHLQSFIYCLIFFLDLYLLPIMLKL